MAVFEEKKSLNDIIINDTMSDDEVVASDAPRGTCFSDLELGVNRWKEEKSMSFSETKGRDGRGYRREGFFL